MKNILVALSLIVLITAGITGCTPGASSTITPAQENESASTENRTLTPGVHVVPSDTIYFDELPDKISPSGNSVEIQLTFTNFDTEARVMKYFPPEIKVESRNLPFTNKIIRTFQAGQEQLELQPGESREYALTWDQKNDFGQQVPYGWYGIRVNLYSREVTDTRSMQGSESQATRVLVLPPGGAIEKDIELDQSHTADGVTVNLEKMEMSNQGAALYTMCVPENYQPEEVSTRYIETDAQYKVDDEDWKPAMKSMFGTFLLKEGVRYIWDLDPVPQNAGEISFQISRIGDHKGLWEFKIQLK